MTAFKRWDGIFSLGRCILLKEAMRPLGQELTVRERGAPRQSSVFEALQMNGYVNPMAKETAIIKRQKTHQHSARSGMAIYHLISQMNHYNSTAALHSTSA